MEAASHTGFIVAAYATACAVIGGLTAWVMLDYRAQRRTLGDLEKLGLKRRSAAAKSEETIGRAGT